MQGGVECLNELWIKSVAPCWCSSQKSVCGGDAVAHEGDDNTPSGPTGRGVKTITLVWIKIITDGLSHINSLNVLFYISKMCDATAFVWVTNVFSLHSKNECIPSTLSYDRLFWELQCRFVPWINLWWFRNPCEQQRRRTLWQRHLMNTHMYSGGCLIISCH